MDVLAYRQVHRDDVTRPTGCGWRWWWRNWRMVVESRRNVHSNSLPLTERDCIATGQRLHLQCQQQQQQQIGRGSALSHLAC